MSKSTCLSSKLLLFSYPFSLKHHSKCFSCTSFRFNIVQTTNNHVVEKSGKPPDGFNETQAELVESFQNNVASWTKRISMNAKMGLNDKALAYFSQMRRTIGVEVNEITLSSVIGICCKTRRLDLGMSLHCLILKMGLLRQLFLTSGLITLYSKSGSIAEARKVFAEMPERDAILWNSMIAAYSQNDLHGEAINTFFMMLKTSSNWKFLMNDFTFATLFKACAGLGCLRIGKFAHVCAIKLGLELNVFVAGSAIYMYSKCDSLDVAFSIFDRMEERDLVAWNSIITGYAQNNSGSEVIELFQQLELEGFAPNETTFSCALKASALVEDSSVGRCFHAKALKCGYAMDIFVGTALVDMYSKFLDMHLAEKAFQDLTKRNLVTFNALITGYSLMGRYEEALRTYTILLSNNLRPDAFTFTGLLSSCSVLGNLDEGCQVHCHSIKSGLDSDVIVGNSLVNLYAKCGLTGNASISFKSIRTPNIVSWAALISGFAQNGDGEKALEYFCELHMLSKKPDEFSLSSVLKALANMAAVEQGKHVHAYVIKMGLEFTVYIGSALIDMYSKCGMVESSLKVFCEMPEKNAVSWNSMIIAYAQNGLSNKSLLLFQEMMSAGVTLTCITFIGVLLACSHEGLVEEGRKYYNSMVFEHKITPSVEHCTCMVDLLGKCGYVEDAESFLLDSPFPSEPGLWRSLLSACQVHNNMDVAVRAAEHCLKLEPRDSSAYVILSNIYASKQLWNEVARIRDLMREMNVEKEPGCSWIEVRNKVNTFAVEERTYSSQFVDDTVGNSLLEIECLDH